MGLLDSILGNTMGAGNSPMRPILAEVLSGLEGQGPQGPTQPGLGGLLQRFEEAGHGGVASSWVGNGPNQPIEPSALHEMFGQDQVDKWSQQSGIAPHELLGQLAEFLPTAINHMTPDGRVPEAASANPFEGRGV